MARAVVKDTIHGWWRSFTTGLELGLFPQLDAETRDSDFLPDFCNAAVIINVVIVAEMLALVITLVTRRISFNLLQDLLLISLFIQWIALTGVAVLCYARKQLNRLSNLRALGMAYLLLLCITVLVSELTVWLLYWIKTIPTPRPQWYTYFHIQNLTVSIVVNALVLRYFLAKHELKQRTLSEAHAKVEALQSRIRPHFVFNSLNIIASLARTAPDKAEAAIEDMAELFRKMLNTDETLVPVKNEIDVANKYLSLEGLRLDNRLAVNWNIGKFPRKAVMPVLTLQPLLENAIRHGIENLPAGGVIDVGLREENNHIHITVTNPVPKTKRKDEVSSHSRSLDNIQTRFKDQYGRTAKLETKEENNQFTVTVVLPIRGDAS